MDPIISVLMSIAAGVAGIALGSWWRSRQVPARDAFFREILNVMPVGVLVYGQNNRLALRNQRMQELFPVADPDSLIGSGRREGASRLLMAAGRLAGMPPDVAEAAVDAWVARAGAEGYVEEELSLNTGRVIRYQARPVSTGGLVIVQTEITALKVAEAEQRTSNAWLMKEISSRKKAEQEVAQAATRLHAIIDAIPVGVVVYDPPEERLSVRNRAMNHLYPIVPGDQPVGQTRRDRLRRAMSAHSAGENLSDSALEDRIDDWLRSVDLDDGALHQLNAAEGRSLWIKSVRLDDDTIIVTNIDVTDLRRAEQRLRDAIDNNDSAIQLYDADLRLILWNEAVSRILPFLGPHLTTGLPYAQAMGIAAAAGVLPADSPYFMDLSKTGVWQGETRDGRFILARHIRTAEGGLLVVHTDLTRLHLAQQSLAQAEQMAALGGLVAGLSHEINTPIGISLTAISALTGWVRDLLHCYQAGDMTRGMLESLLGEVIEAGDVVQRNLERAAGLVASFKRISVDQAADARQRVDLGRYLQDIIATLRPTLRQTPHRLNLSCPAGIVIDTYPGSLSQIVTNLVLNSLTHGFAPDATGTMYLEASSADGHIVLTYSDDGVGVSRDMLKRIFEPFFTTRRSQGGSGLGLSIVYNIVTQQLGGTIRATSEIGSGLTFEIRMPTVPPDRGR